MWATNEMDANLNAVIHAPPRLQICARLAGAETVGFAAMREWLDVSESALSKHVKVLEAAGYLTVRKAASDHRQRTWLALSAAGRTAFAAHATALRALLREADLPAE